MSERPMRVKVTDLTTGKVLRNRKLRNWRKARDFASAVYSELPRSFTASEPPTTNKLYIGYTPELGKPFHTVEVEFTYEDGSPAHR